MIAFALVCMYDGEREREREQERERELVCVYLRYLDECARAQAACVSRRRSDGVQILHQALEVGHLLGQLVRLVALGERNRVTAGGGGGAGREGGKHLEGKRERERGGGRGGGGKGEKKRGRRGGRGSVRVY